MLHNSDLELTNHFLVLKLPFQLVKERYLTGSASQHEFIRGTTLFEDFVVRCVRYAFSDIPASVGRVFFGKWVALPFVRWRMLRHGYLKCPVHWREYAYGEVCKGLLCIVVIALEYSSLENGRTNTILRAVIASEGFGLCTNRSILLTLLSITRMVSVGLRI